MENNIKNGEFRVTIEKEEPIWGDKKRILFFGLPFSFTRYILTPSKFLLEIGFLSKKEEEMRLYRITDVTLTRSFGERLFGLGTLHLLSSDTSTPSLNLVHIRKPKLVKEVLSQAVEECRRQNGVRTSEMVGMTPPLHFPGDGCENNHPAMGPELVPDANHNGIDDRTE